VGVKNGDIMALMTMAQEQLHYWNCWSIPKAKKDGHGPKRSIMFFACNRRRAFIRFSYYSENLYSLWRIPLPISISIW
jgi:hypothetical protein